VSIAIERNPVMDKVKVTLAALLVLAGIVGSVYLASSPLILRLGVILLGFLLAAAVGFTSDPGKRFYVYCQDSITETKKVVWPARKEALQTTGVVAAFVIVMAIFLWIVDALLVWLVRFLIG
jgi:preprotein translocase subunit SecE